MALEMLNPGFANPIPGEWTLWIGSALHAIICLAVWWHCLRYPREPRSTLLWIFITWSFPFVGGLLYVTFGINRVRERTWEKQASDQSFWSLCREEGEGDSQPLAYWRALDKALADQVADDGSAFNRMLDRLVPDHPLLPGNAVSILVDGMEAYPAMLKAIREARHHVHLLTFILGNDAVGRSILDALAERAREGVRVRVLYDRFGSVRAGLFGAFNRWRNVPNMEIAGYTQANPLKRQLQVNLRNHRKILVVDGRIGFTGGMNVRRHHVDGPGGKAIRDYHFEIRGPLVNELQYTFLRDWYFMTGEAPEQLLDPEHFPVSESNESVAGRILNGGPTLENETLTDSYFAAITCARSQLLIVTPYFVPPDSLLRALRAAALRGVEVKILLSKVCNHVSVAYAARSLYESLLGAGVRIYERDPPFIHAKALVADDRYAVIGTANLDERSLKLNYETNLAILNAGFAASLKRIMLDDFARADEITLDLWRQRSRLRQLAENLFALMSPVL